MDYEFTEGTDWEHSEKEGKETNSLLPIVSTMPVNMVKIL